MIAHVALETAPADGPAALAFWQELGFVVVSAPAGLRDRAAWLEREGTQIHLLWTEQPTFARAGHVAVVVPDYDATLERLRAAGFVVEPRTQHWGSPRAHVHAPGGHLVELMAAAPTAVAAGAASQASTSTRQRSPGEPASLASAVRSTLPSSSARTT